MGTLERPVRHGMLTKRSISKSKTTFNAKFQERWFVLTDKTLSYHTPNGQTEKGRIDVNCIRCCEDVEEETFNRSRLFQIVYCDNGKLRALYLQTESRQTHDGWMQSIRLLSEQCSPEKMLRYYHTGAFIKKKWSCCRKTEKRYDCGCANTYISDRIPDYDMHGSKHSASESDSSKQSSSEQVSSDKRTSTMKRKLSLQKMMNTLKLDSPSKSSEPPAHLLEEEDVFSEGDISDEEEEEGAGSFRLKHSLDSSGNSPRFSTGLT